MNVHQYLPTVKPGIEHLFLHPIAAIGTPERLCTGSRAQCGPLTEPNETGSRGCLFRGRDS